MTLLISRLTRDYLETAQTLLRGVHSMADRAVAAQLKAFAEDYEPRAEKPSQAAADWLARLPTLGTWNR
jgi:hypothetical protein